MDDFELNACQKKKKLLKEIRNISTDKRKLPPSRKQTSKEVGQQNVCLEVEKVNSRQEKYKL